MKPTKLAKIRQTIKFTNGKLFLHRSDFVLNTITKSKLIPQYYKNRSGHLLNFNSLLHLTQPKIHLIRSDYNIRKQGALLNYPSQMSVEDEESYTLVRIPEVFIHNTGQLSAIYSTGKTKTILYENTFFFRKFSFSFHHWSAEINWINFWWETSHYGTMSNKTYQYRGNKKRSKYRTRSMWNENAGDAFYQGYN